MLERHTVFYSGRVQGVGFRFRTSEIAKSYDVTGYVRNLSDGRVELAAEGERETLDAFLSAVSEGLSRFISNRTIDRTPLDSKQFDTFTIAADAA